MIGTRRRTEVARRSKIPSLAVVALAARKAREAVARREQVGCAVAHASAAARRGAETVGEVIEKAIIVAHYEV